MAKNPKNPIANANERLALLRLSSGPTHLPVRVSKTMVEKRFAVAIGKTPGGRSRFEMTAWGRKEHEYWTKTAVLLPKPEEKTRFVCIARFRDRADADRCRLGLQTFFPTLKTALNPMEITWPWGVWFDDRVAPALNFTYGLVLMAGPLRAKMDVLPREVERIDAGATG